MFVKILIYLYMHYVWPMSAVHILINEQILPGTTTLNDKINQKKNRYILKVKYHNGNYKKQGKTITYIQVLHILLKYLNVYKDLFMVTALFPNTKAYIYI